MSSTDVPPTDPTDPNAPTPDPQAEVNPLVDTPVSVNPYIMVKPSIVLGTSGSGIEIQCAANGIEASPEQDDNTVETFCGTYKNYKAEVWTITVSAVQSFGTGGLWQQVRPLCNTVVPFTILADSRVAASPTNPKMTGTAFVKGFPFMAGAIGEASEFDLVLEVQGTPTFAYA